MGLAAPVEPAVQAMASNRRQEETDPMADRPLVAITMGDPAGIGAEVTARALDDDWVYQKCRPFVVGSTSAMSEALSLIDSSARAQTAHSIDEVEGRPGPV